MDRYDELTELLENAYVDLREAQDANDNARTERVLAEIEELEAEQDELSMDEYDGQPDEAQEWYDFDPDC